ncbi:Global transcription factor group [Capsicum annuum]|nr:Global transcription factor group [Capsicum annuum]
MTNGRFRRAESGRPYIKCNDCGARFIEAQCDKTLEEWLEMKDAPLEKLLASNQVLGPELAFSPPILIQRFLGKFVGVEDDVEGQVHAIVDKKMDEHTIVHCSKDIEKVEWDFLDFGERNLVASNYVDLICELGIEADSIGGLDLSNSALALA